MRYHPHTAPGPPRKKLLVALCGREPVASVAAFQAAHRGGPLVGDSWNRAWERRPHRLLREQVLSYWRDWAEDAPAHAVQVTKLKTLHRGN
jgi:hypothetical protein